MTELIPLRTFLHRVIPADSSAVSAKRLIENRIFKPRKDNDPFELPAPIDWEHIANKADRNWRMQLQGWTMFHPVMNCFDESSDKLAMAAFFLDIARDWHAVHGGEDCQIVTSRMPESYAWYDMAVGFRALVLTFFQNRIAHFGLSISEEDRELLLTLAAKHIENLTYEPAFSLNNHGIFQIHGLMGLLKAFPALRDEADEKYAAAKMQELCAAQFDPNGVHREHSPHYHFYALGTFRSVIVSGWYGEAVADPLRKAEDISKWVVDPLKHPACIGDSSFTTQQGVSFEPDDHSTKRLERAGLIASTFDESGYAMVRSDWEVEPTEATYLFFMGAYHSKTHKHRDCLSFEWTEQGTKIVCDGGKYGYRTDPFRRYALSSAAHNSLEIEDFDILKTTPYGSALEVVEAHRDGMARLRGTLEFKALRHERDLYLSAGRWLLLQDQFSAKRQRQVIQWLHLNPRFALEAYEEGVFSFRHKDGLRLYLACLTKGAEPRVLKGVEEPVQGYVCEKDYQALPAYAVGFEQGGTTCSFHTVLALSREALFEGEHFARTLDPELDHLVQGCTREPSGILSNTPHYMIANPAAFPEKEAKYTARLLRDGHQFDIFVDFKGAEKTVVMFPGAVDRSKPLPAFQRHTWTGDIHANIIIIADPTINESNELSIGWFQGRSDRWPLPVLGDAIADFLAQHGLTEGDTLLFGSSAGGFAALKLADRFPAAHVLAINPQLNVLRYTRSFVDALLGYSYRGMPLADADKQFPERLRVQLDLDRGGQVHIFQNLKDRRHVRRHLRPFLSGLSIDPLPEEALGTTQFGPLYVHHYDDAVNVHSPPDKDTTIKWIDTAMGNEVGDPETSRQ